MLGHGSKPQNLLDFGTIPNLLYSYIVGQVELEMKVTLNCFSVAAGPLSHIFEVFKSLQISLDCSNVALKLLNIVKISYDVIIGLNILNLTRCRKIWNWNGEDTIEQ